MNDFWLNFDFIIDYVSGIDFEKAYIHYNIPRTH